MVPVVTHLVVITANVGFSVCAYSGNTRCSGNGGNSQCRLQSV